MTWVGFVQVIIAMIALCFIMGFIAAWWEERKKRQEKDK